MFGIRNNKFSVGKTANNTLAVASHRQKIPTVNISQVAPTIGDIVYNIEDGNIYYGNGSAWVPLEKGTVPQFNDTWNSGTSGLNSRSFAQNSELLTPISAPGIQLLSETFIPPTPNLQLTGQHCVSLARDKAYMVSSNENSFAPLFGDFAGNLITCVDRVTNQIVWQRNYKDYTGNDVDYCRGGPTIFGDYMIMVSSNVFAHMQSTADPANPANDLGLKLFGFIPVQGTGRRNASLVCVNRHTGDLVWFQQYGGTATNFNDPDNFLSFGFAARVIENYDMTGNGARIPLIIVGTNLVAQYFYPYILMQERLNNVQAGISLNRDLRTFNSSGNVLFINGNTGDLITQTPIGPRNINTGEILNIPSDPGYDANLDPFLPGSSECLIRENIAAGPLLPSDRYDIGGGNYVVLNLNADAADLNFPEIFDTVPAFAVGIQDIDNTGATVTLAAGQTVAAFPNYDGMNARIAIQWVLGQEGNLFTVPASSSPAIQYSVAVDLIGYRITRKLRSGDAVTNQEAYELNYAGPSSWAGPPAVNLNSNGDAVEVYVALGQGHSAPFDEGLFFDSEFSGSVPAGSNFVDRYQTVATVTGTLPTNIANIRAAEATLVSQVRARAALRTSSISPRGQQWRADSIIAVNLRPGSLGQEIWSFAGAGYDVWTVGQNSSTTRNVGASRATFPGSTGFVKSYNYSEQPNCADGDFGQFCILDSERQRIVWSNKQGHAGRLNITDPNLGPTSYTIGDWQYMGPPSTLGGSNFGSSYDQTNLYTIQRNYANDGVSPLTGSKNFYTPYPYYPKINDNLTSGFTVFNVGDSFVSAYNPTTASVSWESLVTPNNLGTWTVGGTTTNGQIVVTYGTDNLLHIFDASNGQQVQTLPQEGGNGWPAIADNRIYAFGGRAGSGGTSTQYFRVFGLL
jgi:hypothetical protein